MGTDGSDLGCLGQLCARSRRRSGAGVAGSEGRASAARISEGHRRVVVLVWEVAAGFGCWIGMSWACEEAGVAFGGALLRRDRPGR
jgi:hypothetical protein